MSSSDRLTVIHYVGLRGQTIGFVVLCQYCRKTCVQVTITIFSKENAPTVESSRMFRSLTELRNLSQSLYKFDREILPTLSSETIRKREVRACLVGLCPQPLTSGYKNNTVFGLSLIGSFCAKRPR